MKRSRVVMLTLAGASLGFTGCRREPPPGVHSTTILPPEALSPAMRASLPAFRPGSDVSREIPPHNAYDAHLGYYHAPCAGWFPYPYDHFDSRWGYYRCGRWSRYHSTQAYHSSSPYYRGGAHGFGLATPIGGTTTQPADFKPPAGDYGLQPSGAPVHNGVQHNQATKTISSITSRGGFGSTGRSSGFFSGS
jgi:hypothetical protein